MRGAKFGVGDGIEPRRSRRARSGGEDVDGIRAKNGPVGFGFPTDATSGLAVGGNEGGGARFDGAGRSEQRTCL